MAIPRMNEMLQQWHTHCGLSANEDSNLKLTQQRPVRLLHIRLAENPATVRAVQETLEALKKEQVAAEMQMVEVLDELLQSFERSYSELVEGSKQLIMGFFNTARDLEGVFHTQLVVVGQKLYDEKYNVEV